MGDDEQRIYEPYIFIGGKWKHVGEGFLLDDEPCTTAGEAIENLMLEATASFDYSEDVWNSLVQDIKKVCSYHRRLQKAEDRSRRNNATVKRYDHGRTQRTRRK